MPKNVKTQPTKSISETHTRTHKQTPEFKQPLLHMHMSQRDGKTHTHTYKHTFAHNRQVPDDPDSHRSPVPVPTQWVNVIGCYVRVCMCACVCVCNFTPTILPHVSSCSVIFDTHTGLQPGPVEKYLSVHAYSLVTTGLQYPYITHAVYNVWWKISFQQSGVY